jgi:hypothetical protein
LTLRLWVHGRPAREFGWNLNHRLIDENSYRVQVAGIAFQAKPLRLQGQRTAARKRIVESGELVAIK